MTKKLKSRQDILDVWVSKGAMYGKIDILSVTQEHQRDVCHWKLKNNTGKGNIYLDLYRILYSPESNFFEVIFPTTEENEYKIERDMPSYSQEMKMNCSVSQNPLQYLLDQLNNSF